MRISPAITLTLLTFFGCAPSPTILHVPDYHYIDRESFQPDENAAPDDFPAGYEIIDDYDRLGQRYLDGRFSVAYFSLGAVPSHAQDWDFFAENYGELLEMTGGRLQDDHLEMCQLRVVAKQTKAQRLFNAIKRKLISSMERGEITTRKLISSMERGEITIDGHDYPDIYYSPEAVDLKLWENIRSKKWEYYLKQGGRPT